MSLEKERAAFPSRLFRWFISQQILFSALLFVLLSAALFFYVEYSGYPVEVIRFGRKVALMALAASFLVLILISLVMARRLLIPLGRLIEKTRRLREFPLSSEDTEPEALTFDEPGEWFELERALNRLGRDLRNKTIRLSREKTELRTIMTAISEAVLAISDDRKVLFYNPQFALSFNPQVTGSNVTISQILREPDVLEAYMAALSTGSPERRELQLAVAGDRAPRFFELSVAPLRKKHNQEVYGAVGVFYDITELKKAERIRIEFVGNVSHELRTPLTTINGYIQTLIADVKSGRLDQAGEFLNIVSKNATRLKSLVEDLLDLSALESGKELRIERVNVQDITEAVISQINASSHKIHISYGFNEMNADGKRLEQVLRNLMENAIRYVPDGRNIEIRWLKSAQGRPELHVKDDGPGIAPEHQARLFERFYRVDEARSREKGGTGIGLSLTKHIVQRHGGQIFVKSQLDQGAEFICEFPADNEGKRPSR
jgi:two-component system phosphate regulon sensor histidine kinase PhoR